MFQKLFMNEWKLRMLNLDKICPCLLMETHMHWNLQEKIFFYRKKQFLYKIIRFHHPWKAWECLYGNQFEKFYCFLTKCLLNISLNIYGHLDVVPSFVWFSTNVSYCSEDICRFWFSKVCLHLMYDTTIICTFSYLVYPGDLVPFFCRR